MKIAVVHPSQGLSGGYRKYFRCLMPLLKQHPEIADLTVFVHSALADEFQDLGCNLECWTNGDRLLGFPGLKRLLEGLRTEVAFMPTARWINLGSIPTVVMLHNMEPLVAPFRGNAPREALRNVGRVLAAKRSCKRAARVIAPSNFVKEYLVRRWRLPEHKVGVVYNGVHRQSSRRRPAGLTFLEGGERPRFLFAAGSIRPARGLEDAIRALAILKEWDSEICLVIAGGFSGEARSLKDRLSNLARSLAVDKSVVWTGALSNEEMTWCYDKCAAFAMTSRVEAGPNIALEAMSRGCLTVSTDRPPMPEFFLQSALYYSPGDARRLAERLREVIGASDDEKRQKREIALRRASEFSWSDAAANTYQQLKIATQSARGLQRR